jgi:hypothetical protein
VGSCDSGFPSCGSNSSRCQTLSALPRRTNPAAARDRTTVCCSNSSFDRLMIHGDSESAPGAPHSQRGLVPRLQCACEGVELAGWKSLSVLDVSTVTERNCVAARRGGEHREVNDQSVTSVNSIRPIVVASLLENAKPKTPVDPRRESRSHDRGRGRPQTKRNHIKSGDDRGGWRRNDRKIQRDKQGDLPEQVAASREKVARGRRGHTPTGLAPIR